MESYVIHGGNRLSGKVKVDSAKNSVLPIIAATILTNEEVAIKNCPKILDVINMVKILESLGARCEFFCDDLIIDAKNIDSFTIPCTLTKELRSSIFLLGALLSRLKRAEISYPGGCDIGKRPIDIHVDALKSLGVEINEDEDKIFCRYRKNHGGKIRLKFPSVGATENVILASVFSKGKTEIHNCAKEPEIVDLMCFLNSMGAKIYGAGTSTILIEGVEKLHGTTFRPIPDRIEAGTFLIAAAITGGEVELCNCKIKNIFALVHKLCNNTCKIRIKDDIIYLQSGRSRKSFSLTTSPYPGFPTDLQPQMTALAAVSEGESRITENLFDMRFGFADELVKMGADIKLKDNVAFIKGVKTLKGADVTARDLRGGAALVLAGLQAEGQTTLCGIRHVERGYFNFDGKLRSLGAQIIRRG